MYIFVQLFLQLYYNFNFPTLDCACYIDGSLNALGFVCTSTEPCPCQSKGVCNCVTGFTGDKCDNCELGYYDADGNESDSTTSCKGNSFICV